MRLIAVTCNSLFHTSFQSNSTLGFQNTSDVECALTCCVYQFRVLLAFGDLLFHDFLLFAVVSHAFIKLGADCFERIFSEGLEVLDEEIVQKFFSLFFCTYIMYL